MGGNDWPKRFFRGEIRSMPSEKAWRKPIGRSWATDNPPPEETR